MNKLHVVFADWDFDVGVWFATSDDVPGLVTEAPTVEALDSKLRHLVPELLQANGFMPASGFVTIELVCRRVLRAGTSGM